MAVRGSGQFAGAALGVQFHRTLGHMLGGSNVSAVRAFGNQFNCSYAIAFVKHLPKTLQLERAAAVRRTSAKQRKIFHGIHCVDDDDDVVPSGAVQSDHVGDIKRGVIWCLVALSAVLSVALMSTKFREAVKKCRSNGDEPQIHYQHE